MSMTIFVLWIMNAVVDSIGQLAFKAAAIDSLASKSRSSWLFIASRPYVWFGVMCYVVEFLLWIAFISLVPLSDGVLLGSINIVAVMILGRLIFNEYFSTLRVMGITLVCIGVAVVGIQG